MNGDTKPPAVIFDVDGTLVDVSGVRHYVLGPKKDFGHFHAGASLCPPIESTVALLNTFLGAATIIIVTARMEEWRHPTRQWLQKHDIPHAHLLMRSQGDRRKDVEVKGEILAKIRETYDVVLAVDDNPNVIGLWAEHGIPTVIVPGWEADPADPEMSEPLDELLDLLPRVLRDADKNLDYYLQDTSYDTVNEETFRLARTRELVEIFRPTPPLPVPPRRAPAAEPFVSTAATARERFNETWLHATAHELKAQP